MPRRTERKRFISPLVKSRCYWSADELQAETLALARLGVQPAQPETATASPAALEPPTPSQEPQKAPTTKKRKPKELYPTVYKLQFNEEGEFLDFAEPHSQPKERIINARPPHTK